MTITAAADGSALGNPGPCGWAWYIDDANWAAGGSPHGTNNQGELQAVLELLRATAAVAGEKLVIECDSRYVIDSVTKWMPGWKRKGWRKADGGPVLNRELLEGIDAELRGRDVSFSWVKGHAGHPLNEAADQRANAAATAYQRKQEPARGPGFTAAAPVIAGASTSIPETAGPTHSTAADGGSGAAGAASARTEAPPLWAEASDLLDSLDLPAATPPIDLRIALSTEEHARLRDRADAQGVSLEEALRRLI
ncbi:ribonuclease H family protein [Microbacterium xylanilyticum]